MQSVNFKLIQFGIRNLLTNLFHHNFQFCPTELSSLVGQWNGLGFSFQEYEYCISTLDKIYTYNILGHVGTIFIVHYEHVYLYISQIYFNRDEKVIFICR